MRQIRRARRASILTQKCLRLFNAFSKHTPMETSAQTQVMYSRVHTLTQSHQFSSVSSVAQWSPALCNPMGPNTPGLPVHHQLPECTQTHVHWVGDASQPSHPLCPLLLLPSIFPRIRVFSNGQFFSSGGQSIEVSALTSVLPMNIQDWFPLGWTGWISLLSEWLSRVFSNTTVQKHQFFGVQLSL